MPIKYLSHFPPKYSLTSRISLPVKFSKSLQIVNVKITAKILMKITLIQAEEPT